MNLPKEKMVGGVKNYNTHATPDGFIRMWNKFVKIEDKAIEQLEQVASMPFVAPYVAAMPDTHWGMGATVGSVIPTQGAVMPAAVGVDIGCGMMAVRPIGDTVTEVAVQRRVVKVSEAASSSDLQIVNVEVTLGYHIDPAYAEFALVQLNNDAEERVIKPANLEAIKARTAQFEVQGLVKQRELVRAGIENDVRGRLAVQHIILEDMSITNFSFSADYEHAIEQKQVAEQSAEKAKNILEQTKIEAEQVAAKAKGEADARRAQAEGEASAILVEAQAKAKAQELQRQSLTPELLELRRIEMWNNKWGGDVPQYLVGGSGGGFGMLLQAPSPKAKKQAGKDGDGNQ